MDQVNFQFSAKKVQPISYLNTVSLAVHVLYFKSAIDTLKASENPIYNNNNFR